MADQPGIGDLARRPSPARSAGPPMLVVGGPTLIVGLGNPGKGYASHRHNVGFHVVEALARTHRLSFSRQKGFRARVAEGRIAGRRVILAKPQTFMNRSGRAVGRLVRARGIELGRLLVVYDDLDLPLGRLRLRPEGGAGGHRGMRSILDTLGSQAFPRLRVGIGRPPGQLDPADYVLRPFQEQERPVLSQVVARAVAAIECWLTDGLVTAMDEFNQPFLPDEGRLQE
jgi:PTH1 family peptidyl-tRNA hydrolase